MRGRGKKILITIFVFIGAVIGSFFIINYNPGPRTVEMSEPTLPVLYVSRDGHFLNEMHGYRKEMDMATMRDGITQLTQDYKMQLLIDTYGAEVKDISCTVYSVNGEKTIGDAAVSKITQEEKQSAWPGSDAKAADSHKVVTLDFGKALLDNTEYQAVLSLNTDGETVYYYFRVAYFAHADYDRCFKYVSDFHSYTIDKKNKSQIADSLEPLWNASNDSFAHVNINNNADTVCWGDLPVKEAAPPVIMVKEINSVYSVFEILSTVTAGADDAKKYYEVSEYFRVRSASDHIYLLDYERNAEQIFGGVAKAGSSLLELGIRSENVTMASNAAANIVSFLQAGELWSYRQDGNEFTKIASFRSGSGYDMDARDSYREHGIRIIRVDENGNTDFIVYGYMNRGPHEGYSGISVCHYDILDDAVIEKYFIPQQTSYQQMKERIGKTMYLTDEDDFYFCAGDKMYRISPDASSQEEVYNGMSHTIAANNGRYVAWTEEKQGIRTNVMHICDLNTMEIYDVKAEDGKYLRPLGFLESDCIFGIATKKDLKKSNSHERFPMSEIHIMDTEKNHKILKTYSKKKTWFDSAVIEDSGTIILSALKQEDGVFVNTDPVTITNNEIMARAKINVDTENETDFKTQVVLKLISPVPAFATNLITPEIAPDKKSHESVLDESLFASDYYVYAKGRVFHATKSLAVAVRSADENAGLVVDRKQNTVWSRAKETWRDPMELTPAGGKSQIAKAVNVMLSAMGNKPSKTDKKLEKQTVFELLQEAQGNGRIMDLTGCTLPQVMYYVDKNTPVLAKLSKNRMVLICGYTSSEVWYYDPEKDETTRTELEAATEEFSGAGNEYYIYLR